MRKTILTLLVSLGLLMALTTVGPLRIPTDKNWYVDSIGASDTITIIYQFVGRELTGAFTLQYHVLSVAGDTAVKLYYSESNDYSHGWYNATKIDSCVEEDSALVDFDPRPCQYIKLDWTGFGAAGDTVLIWHKIYGIQSK